jgi:hypothetical protein
VTIVETDPTDHIQTITRQFKTLAKRQTGKWKITGNCGFTVPKRLNLTACDCQRVMPISDFEQLLFGSYF